MEFNESHNNYISLNTSKTMIGPDIITPKVHEYPIDM